MLYDHRDTMDEQQDKSFLVEEAYDDAAALNTRDHIQEHYGTHPLPWYDWVWSHLHLRPGMRWLDLGCGPAHLWWRRRGWLPPESYILLTDLSAGMVATAKHNLDGVSAALEFTVADSETLPAASHSVDAVIALGLLDHLPHLTVSLREIRRVLRPHGFLYASCGGRRHLQELEGLVQPFVPEPSYGGDPEAFGLENGTLRLAPFFRHVARYDYEDQLVFREVEPLFAYVCSEAATGTNLHGASAAAFRDHVERLLAEEGPIRITRHKGLFAAQL